MTIYTGEHGILKIDSVAFAVAEVTANITRGTASHPRSGSLSDIQFPGKIGVTGTITRIMTDGELLGYAIGDTTVSGSAVALDSGVTAPGAAGESIKDMDTSTASASSRIQLTALTAAVTASGYAIVYGTDVNDDPISEIIAVPTLAVSEAVQGDVIFKTATHIAAFDWVQAGGTIKVDAIAGAASLVVDTAQYFDIDMYVESGSSNIHLLANNCFLTSGSFSFTDADNIVGDVLNWTMQDPTADLSLTYVV